MKTKQLGSAILCLLFALCLAGCGGKNKPDVPPPSIEMKTVSLNSLEDYVTFVFELPEDWISGSSERFSAVAAPQSAAEKDLDSMEQLSYLVNIAAYSTPTESAMAQVYKELYTGNPEPYHKLVNQPPPSFDAGAGDSFLDYLDALTPEPDTSAQPPYGEDYIGEFQYKLHQGKNGKIAEVQYKYQIEGKEYHTIECFCEASSCKVTGAFDDSLGLSSGDIALWVADSLQATRNFTYNDGQIEKKG